jgi:hypothetical protein
MRRYFAISGVIIAAVAVGWIAGRFWHVPAIPVPPPPTQSDEGDVRSARSFFLVPGFRAGEVEAIRDRFGTSMSRLEFEGKPFWLIVFNYGDGVPYTSIGLYAMTGDGAFKLCLEADSCGAGYLKPELDPKTGVFQLREHAYSTLEGKVILACNLRSVGTYDSVHGR